MFFVSAESPERIRKLYADILNKLRAKYQQSGISLTLEITPTVSDELVAQAKQSLLEAMSSNELYVEVSGEFYISNGPNSSDHMVYSKSYPVIGTPTRYSIGAFQKKYGYLPQVFAFKGVVLGVGQTPKKAMLALRRAQDGARVKQLA
jgi:hypothetical protein